MFFIIMFVLYCIGSGSAYAGTSVSASDLESHKDSARQIYNMTDEAYKSLRKKMQEDEETRKMAEIKASAEEYYELGKLLEEQGKDEQASLCYKKVLSLFSDSKFKRYINIRNSKLKGIARREKKRAVKKLKNEEELYEELSSFDTILAELNSRIDSIEAKKNNEY
ncbi:MAG: hypothetical protein ABIG55_02870 [Candidatus Omnitrophota bacterium]|nr:hypothetical protein [Candidatus Omnitrophota bacterium]